MNMKHSCVIIQLEFQLGGRMGYGSLNGSGRNDKKLIVINRRPKIGRCCAVVILKDGWRTGRLRWRHNTGVI